MKNIKLLMLAVITVLSFNSCTDEVEAPQTPFATFETNSSSIGVDQNGSTSKSFKIYTANVVNSDRTIGVTVDMSATNTDAAAYTIPPTVTIPAGTNEGILTVGITDVNVTLAGSDLVIKLDQTESILTGESLKLNISENCPNSNESKVAVTLTFDNWPEEVAWRILDSTGATVMQSSSGGFAYGGHASEPDGSTLNLPQSCMASGSYTLQVYDQYGDGGTEYTITANGVQLVSIAADAYTTSTSRSFSF